jgi:hypothetical protein
VSFCVGYVVNEHASSNDASAASEVADSVLLGVFRDWDIVVLQIVVVEAGILVAPVPESVSLGTALGVDMD